MKRVLLIILIIFISFASEAKNMRVGLFYHSQPTKIKVDYHVGRYTFFSENESFTTLSNKSDKLVFVAQGNKVIAYYNDKTLGAYTWFRLEKNAEQNSLKISDAKTSNTYLGNIVVYAIEGKLKVVNEISIDNYVEGVIKGEAGYGYSLEYYKVQAVISRTYSLHYPKHLAEGFDLCDHTHCQVYKGINTHADITQAVKETTEEVLVDSGLHYINTLFHSNCGGHTVTSDFVWSKKLECMESVKDTFCLNSRQAKWKKTIPKATWLKFLAAKTKKPISYYSSKNIDFNQPSRKEYYTVGSEKIRLVDIRKEFGLRSTFFSVYQVGDQIVLIGKGYGHGVGLCQEGGIVMAKTRNYKEILHFYYQDVSIMSISQVEYYRLF